MKDYKIEILNIGAIKKVKLNLNKVNIFMGQQSSGKSTIAKIISFCNWVEKDVSIRQSFNDYSNDKNYFIEKLETFHKMKGYFNEKSEIKYQSKAIKLHYKWDDFEISWINRFDYKRNKISYIPSERSVAILPEMEKVELSNNYIKSFLFDWFDARKNYPKDNKISILNADIEYYYSESSKESHIQNKNNSYDILLSHASSGLQSMTPLIVMIDHLINNIYNDEQNLSYELDEVRAKVTQMLISEIILKPLYGKDFTEKEERRKVILEINKKISEKDETILIYFEKFKKIRSNLFQTHSTNLILEEPEQNLFPETQKTLIYYLLESISSDLEHNLTLTTHSPYVLYAINNCIMANLVYDKLSENEKKNIFCLNSKVDPKSISIYQIKNGLIECIQQEDGLIGENFFDEQMKQVMDEFYLMLNHY
ncbi:MAG TPA: AAA family ATPase [Flavobacterium sp.]|nr:AAA family ATPase [Flavobacterium sp.]